MLDAPDLHCPANDLARIQRLTEGPQIGMEKSLASVGRPTRREFLFEDEPDVLGPDVGLGTEHDLNLERDEDRRTYFEVFADQPHGVQIVSDRLSQLV